MITDLEIYRGANQLVKRYGADAELEAASRVDAMIGAGDPDGAAVWKRIRCAVEDLQRAKPSSGEVVH